MSKGHVMLDIETLGVSPGCVILSLSAVEFDINTGELGESFNMGIDIKSCVDAGLTIDPSTMKWWMEQSEQARRASFYAGNSLEFVLGEFVNFMNSVGPACVWGNGVRFDVGILEGAYKALNRKMPIEPRMERDVRTLVSFRPDVKKNMPFEGEPHVPLDDCKHQIKYCCAIWKDINTVK